MLSRGLLQQGFRAFRLPVPNSATLARSTQQLAGLFSRNACSPTSSLTRSTRSISTITATANRLSRSFLSDMKATPRMLFEASPRGQQSRGARWEQYTKANYGSNRGNSYRNSGRRRPFFPQISPEAAVYSIIGINGVVFLLWRSGQERMNSFRDSKLLSWMFRNFTTMWANLREGRVWTLITPAFSHIEPLHLFVNMFVLYSFGPDLARLLGVKRFLAFYLGAAACGNLISALLRGVVFPVHTRTYNSATQPSLGASTSVVGITTLFACLYPNATFQIFFFLPVPAWLATAGFIGWDVWRVMRSERTKVDGAGHLGGAAAGLGYYWFRLRPLIRRMR